VGVDFLVVKRYNDDKSIRKCIRRLKMTLSAHDSDVDKLLTKGIKEFRYVVKNDERVMIPASISVKKALDIYKTHRGIRTLPEALWRSVSLGIRYDLVQEDPRLPALREIEDLLLSHIKKNRQKFYRRANKRRRGLDQPPRKV